MKNRIETMTDRISCAMIDMVLSVSICLPLSFIAFFLNITVLKALSFSLFVSIFICKDFVLGRSFGKKICNLEIVNNYGGGTPYLLQLIIRNLFFPVWPLECLMYIINPSRRLGDILCGTKVIHKAKNDKIIFNKKHIIVWLILWLFLFLFYWRALIYLISNNPQIKLLYS